MNIDGVAKPNAFQTSGLPNASRQHLNDDNKKERGGWAKIGTAHKMRKVFGIPEVSKTLGIASHSVMLALIMFSAAGYNGHVSTNPLYPTYKTRMHASRRRSDLRIATIFIPLLNKEGLGEVVDCFEQSTDRRRTPIVLAGWVSLHTA